MQVRPVILFNKTISSFIERNNLLYGCSKIIVAVSGGVDSMVLLDVLKKLKKVDLAIVHVNHNLRGAESDSDERLVKKTAAKFGIKAFVESVDVKSYAKQNSLSIETAARLLRLQTFERLIQAEGFDAVATGHHANDNIETVTHRLLRGTGFRGLAGINPKRTIESVNLISPMLCVNRNEIVEYAKQNNIQWRQDSTNDTIEFTRNKIRHLLLPKLQNQSKGNIYEVLQILCEKCGNLNILIDKQVASLRAIKKTGDGITVDTGIIRKLNPLVQVEIIRQALIKAGCGLKNITQQHYEAVIDLCNKPGATKIELPNNFVAEKQLDQIRISKCKNQNDTLKFKNESFQATVPLSGSIEFESFIIESKLINIADCSVEDFIKTKNEFIEWFDADRINGEIAVRGRLEGDRFVPIGYESEKKVGKFITSAKPEYNKRGNILIFSDNRQIIWVYPLRASETTKIVNNTRKVLEISVTHKP